MILTAQLFCYGQGSFITLFSFLVLAANPARLGKIIIGHSQGGIIRIRRCFLERTKAFKERHCLVLPFQLHVQSSKFVQDVTKNRIVSSLIHNGKGLCVRVVGFFILSQSFLQFTDLEPADTHFRVFFAKQVRQADHSLFIQRPSLFMLADKGGSIGQFPPVKSQFYGVLSLFLTHFHKGGKPGQSLLVMVQFTSQQRC